MHNEFQLDPGIYMHITNVQNAVVSLGKTPNHMIILIVCKLVKNLKGSSHNLPLFSKWLHHLEELRESF